MINVPRGKDRHSSPEHNSWRAMRKRCYYEGQHNYPAYGGRGITVCDRWNDPKTGFESFVMDMGNRPEGMTLDRIDPDGNYEPDNCRWATDEIQRQNRRVKVAA
jgi:hypothetical protein